MPGRVSTQSSHQSTAVTAADQSSNRKVKLAASSTASASSAQAATSDESPTSKLRLNICRIFADAQHTAVSHRKLVINLRRVQEECCYKVGGRKGKEEMEGWDEQSFNDELERCVMRLMSAKRGEAVGDRLVKFLGLFLRHASDKGGTSNLGLPLTFLISNV